MLVIKSKFSGQKYKKIIEEKKALRETGISKFIASKGIYQQKIEKQKRGNTSYIIRKKTALGNQIKKFQVKNKRKILLKKKSKQSNEFYKKYKALVNQQGFHKGYKNLGKLIQKLLSKERNTLRIRLARYLHVNFIEEY